MELDDTAGIEIDVPEEDEESSDSEGQKEKSAAFKDGCGFTLLPRVKRDPYVNAPLI